MSTGKATKWKLPHSSRTIPYRLKKNLRRPGPRSHRFRVARRRLLRDARTEVSTGKFTGHAFFSNSLENPLPDFILYLAPNRHLGASAVTIPVTKDRIHGIPKDCFDATRRACDTKAANTDRSIPIRTRPCPTICLKTRTTGPAALALAERIQARLLARPGQGPRLNVRPGKSWQQFMRHCPGRKRSFPGCGTPWKPFPSRMQARSRTASLPWKTNAQACSA